MSKIFLNIFGFRPNMSLDIGKTRIHFNNTFQHTRFAGEADPMQQSPGPPGPTPKPPVPGPTPPRPSPPPGPGPAGPLECSTGADCKNENFPYCNKNGKCVQCLISAHCIGGVQLCINDICQLKGSPQCVF